MRDRPRGPRLVLVLAMLLTPLFVLLVDPEPLHRAGRGPGRLAGWALLPRRWLAERLRGAPPPRRRA